MPKRNPCVKDRGTCVLASSSTRKSRRSHLAKILTPGRATARGKTGVSVARSGDRLIAQDRGALRRSSIRSCWQPQKRKTPGSQRRIGIARCCLCVVKSSMVSAAEESGASLVERFARESRIRTIRRRISRLRCASLDMTTDSKLPLAMPRLTMAPVRDAEPQICNLKSEIRDGRCGYSVTLPVAAHSTPRRMSFCMFGSRMALKSWPRALWTLRPLPYGRAKTSGSSCLLQSE